MRKVITILMLILLMTFMLCPVPCRANTIGEDKYAHAGASMAVGVFMAQNKPFNKWCPWQRVLFNVIVVGGQRNGMIVGMIIIQQNGAILPLTA